MLFDKLKREKRHTYEVPKRDPGLDQPLSPTLEDTLARLTQLTGQTADLQVNPSGGRGLQAGLCDV